jgi:O-antigen biosynthesis protein WbqP
MDTAPVARTGDQRNGEALPKIVERMKRVFDIVFALACILALLPIIILVAIIVKLTSNGPAIYWSNRVGRNNQIFRMPKFRTMIVDTPAVATHQLDRPDRWLTPIGATLRATSLDELPQLWPILIGKMSVVGPRPALFNQDDLVALRTQNQVHLIRPGLTGWAQVNGRDTLSIAEKVAYDIEYLAKKSLWFDIKIITRTMIKVIFKDDVSH